MKPSLKITQIETKISNLQFQKQHLLEECQKEIAALIAALDLTLLEDKILIGGLQFLKHKVSTKDRLVEEWHDVGERFLRHTKRNRKLQPSKKDSYPQPMPQPTHKSPQSREKKNEDAKAI